jgi:hypothetical protein
MVAFELEAPKTHYSAIEGKIAYDGSKYLQPHVQAYGDTAILSYRDFFTNHAENGRITDRTSWNCAEVYTWLEGQRKIVHTHWSYVSGRKPPEDPQV